MRAFCPISKKEEQADGTIKVWGWMSSATPDADGDTILPSAIEEALPEYMKFGNIREMHQPTSAAGVALGAEVQEDGRTRFGAHVVDPIAVKKVKTGTYKGFSLGGDAIGFDPKDDKIITKVVINEVSLVDRPANPDAVFELWKAKKMTTSTKSGVETELAAADELMKMFDAGEVTSSQILALAKAAKKKPKAPYGDVKYADTGYQEDKKPRYPIDTEEHIRAAWNYVHKEANAEKYSSGDLSKVKAAIVAAWKDKIDADGPPSSVEKLQKMSEDMAECMKAYNPECGIEKSNTGTAGATQYDNDPEAVAKAAKSKKEKTEMTAAEKEELEKKEKKEKEEKEASEKDALAKAAQATKTKADQEAEEQAAKDKAETARKAAEKEKALNGGALRKSLMGSPGVVPMLEATDIGMVGTFKAGELTALATIKEIGEDFYKVEVGNCLVEIKTSALMLTGDPGDKPQFIITMDEAQGVDMYQTGEDNTKKAARSGALQKMASKPLQKGMYNVTDLAYLLTGLNSLTSSVTYEQAIEKDSESELPVLLKSWLAAGAALLRTMVEEETKEMVEGVDVETVSFELAARSGTLQKVNALLTEKVQTEDGRRALQKSFGATVEADDEDDAIAAAAKAGDFKQLMKAVNSKVIKVTDGKVRELEKSLHSMQGVLAKLEAQPAATRGILKSVGKNGDTIINLEETGVTPVNYEGKPDPVSTALKKAHANPGRFVPGGRVLEK